MGLIIPNVQIGHRIGLLFLASMLAIYAVRDGIYTLVTGREVRQQHWSLSAYWRFLAFLFLVGMLCIALGWILGLPGPIIVGGFLAGLALIDAVYLHWKFRRLDR
jgi:hypothetical protein